MPLDTPAPGGSAEGTGRPGAGGRCVIRGSFLQLRYGMTLGEPGFWGPSSEDGVDPLPPASPGPLSTRTGRRQARVTGPGPPACCPQHTPNFPRRGGTGQGLPRPSPVGCGVV